MQHEITEYQRKLMRHTIGEPNRNWFHSSNNKHSKEFKKLALMGFATKEKTSSWMRDGAIYRLTKTGKEAISNEMFQKCGQINRNIKKLKRQLRVAKKYKKGR